MIIAVVLGIAGALAIVGAAIALPCPACEQRRQRLKAAYEAWRKQRRH